MTPLDRLNELSVQPATAGGVKVELFPWAGKWRATIEAFAGGRTSHRWWAWADGLTPAAALDAALTEIDQQIDAAREDV